METTIPALNSNVAGLCKPQTVPVVCIGMSPRGIWPLKTIFKQLSTTTRLAFVVVHHVRNVPMLLPELLSARTEMPAALAVEGQSVGPNSVYVLPPGMEIVLSDGSFAMRPQTKRRRFSNVLAILLDSLSKSGHPGVAVILSGVDAEGAATLKVFRRRGGITIAQEPRTAERPQCRLPQFEQASLTMCRRSKQSRANCSSSLNHSETLQVDRERQGGLQWIEG